MSTSNRRGSALLAVLWLSAVLAAIAFSLASTVRGEAERAATSVDSSARLLPRHRRHPARHPVHDVGPQPGRDPFVSAPAMPRWK